MKKSFSLIVLAFLVPLSLLAESAERTRVIEVTILLDSADFTLDYFPESNTYYISNTSHSKYPFVDEGQENDPMIPWCSVMIPIQDNEAFVSFNTSSSEVDGIDSVLIAPYPTLMPTSASKAHVKRKVKGDYAWDGTYPNEIYPDHVVDYVSTMRVPEWAKDIYKADKIIWMQVCPFRYYAQEQALKLLKVQLQVTVESTIDGISSSPSQSTLSSHPLTDISGRRLTTPPTRPGVYIKDGRKVMIK